MKNSKNLQTQIKAEKAKRELSRRHLINYCEYVYDGYIRSWHIEQLCDALERVDNGEIRYLFVEEPPRHSKTLNVSQLYPSWSIGRNPDKQFIVSSYSGDLATDSGRETRDIIHSQEYQNVFNNVRLASDSKAKSKWNVQKLVNGVWKKAKGMYNAVGVGGSITGKGADVFVVDDPFKDRKEADSVLIRDERWRWLRAVARTRLSPTGAMVITHTRWHDDDIIGRLTEGEDAESYVMYEDYIKNGLGDAKWVRIKLQAIATEDETYRKEGEALWPSRYPLEELQDIKAMLGGYEWSALYQQEPVDEENRVFKKEWFKYRAFEEVREMSTTAYMSVDTPASSKATEGTDYYGITINFVDTENQWNLLAFRMKFSLKDFIDFLFTAHTQYTLDKIGIEKTAFTEGMSLYLDEEMNKRKHYLPIVDLKHGGTKKEIRIESLQPRYERGTIFHIKRHQKNSCSDLEDELLRFPKATNDDVSDSTAYQNQMVQPDVLIEQSDLAIY